MKWGGRGSDLLLISRVRVWIGKNSRDAVKDVRAEASGQERQWRKICPHYEAKLCCEIDDRQGGIAFPIFLHESF